MGHLAQEGEAFFAEHEERNSFRGLDAGKRGKIPSGAAVSFIISQRGEKSRRKQKNCESP
ncbi:hypothetical protein BACCAP_00343 [Pseudoflavonifractor capillosus ATCC 29799]|uniref:Uncharacterized protein n=1 Tax=Pseudoflavonifractor capillosus ATCC 29799 TaxID=411467 RepID=A6NQ72_9FIRM|nr:hypothetical protein BACCAP_00343 [Pseudoflavonifractor capillosus ATCC 29799]